MTVQNPKVNEKQPSSTEFDSDWYRKEYPDVEQLGIDPFQHFQLYGRALGRKFKASAGGKPNQMIVAATPVISGLQDNCGADAQHFVRTSLEAFAGIRDAQIVGNVPRVSVIMTAYNAVDTIEAAVLSMIFQTWQNLEVVVCDDFSNDGTWPLLCELRDKFKGSLKIVRLHCNSGTYLAKNIAISHSTGDYICFQDSDDVSHPDRVKLQVLPLIMDMNLVATRTKYSRINPSSGKIVPVGGLQSKFGLITLLVRRSAFDEIGYFDAVRKAGDDEWFQRLRHLYGSQRVQDQDVTLYLATLRENSLISDMLSYNADGSIEQSSSLERRDYVKIFKSRFSDKGKKRSWYRASFPIYPRVTVEKLPEKISALPMSCAPIIAAMCSIPARERQLTKVVEQISAQVDQLFVYLDKYNDVPMCLIGNPKVTVLRSQDYDCDYRDNAKFLPYMNLKRKHGSFFYVTCDDDLDYPYDYVQSLVRRVENFDRAAVVGVHGVVLEEVPTGYFRRRFVYHFCYNSLSQPKLVNNLGSGTIAFHSDIFPELDPKKWKTGGMVDIFLSIEARKMSVPMICMDRSVGWLREQEMPQENTTLFDEFSMKDDAVLEQLLPHCPWGYSAISDVVDGQSDHLRTRLQLLTPPFFDEIKLSQTIRRLR